MYDVFSNYIKNYNFVLCKKSKIYNNRLLKDFIIFNLNLRRKKNYNVRELI